MKELTQKENAAYQLIRVFDADGVQQMKRIEKDQ
jgi:YD repeat-containing protein